MKTRLKLFLNWGIQFEEAYAVKEQSERKVVYADKAELETEILRKFPQIAVPVKFEEDFAESNVTILKKGLPKTKSTKNNNYSNQN